MSDWIKVHRRLRSKAFYSKDSEKVHLWLHLLFKANFKDTEELLGGKPIICKPGQFTTGRKQLSLETGICESKIERILTYFQKIEQQIKQLKTTRNRLITILNWDEYQQSEQQIKQQVNNKRTTSEQQVNTLEEYKEYKEIKNNIYREFDHLKISIEENNKLLEKYSQEKLDEIYDKIQNYSKNKKYKNLYLTACNWLKKEDLNNSNNSKFTSSGKLKNIY